MTITRGLLIGSEEGPASGGRTVDDIDPFTGDVMATVAASTPGDVKRAVDEAESLRLMVNLSSIRSTTDFPESRRPHGIESRVYVCDSYQ